MPGQNQPPVEALAPGPIATIPRQTDASAPVAPSGRKARARNENRWAAFGILWHAWPQGKPTEGPAVLVGVFLALGQLLSWLATVLAQMLFIAVSGLARAFAALARALSRDRLGIRGAAVLGWLIAVVAIGATGAALDINRTRILDHFSASANHTHVYVPYQPPPSTCTLPRGVCAPPTEVLDGQPSISASAILRVLASYQSPAATPEFASALYDFGIQYGVNPAYALGFFIEESQAGTQGLAATTQSLGNIRYTQSNSPVSYSDYQGFRRYTDWRAGAEDWYWLMRTYYLNKGVRDIYDVTPIYAPSSDNNDPNGYARTVYNLVMSWHS